MQSELKMVEQWGMVAGYQMPSPPASYQPNPPKVGFGVICRCPGSGVQCLLQKRGLNSASPNKWSFPGGRLENPGDLDEDGDVGTRRELEEECGGGEPLGLPSLIHIECYKSGKVKQTIYHVYAIDTSTDKEWESWKPKPKNEKGSSEVDTTATDLIVNDQAFPSLNGYCWVDMHALIQECDKLAISNVDMTEATDLQHGLVRWVQNYGDHVLRTLIQRSPKLPHHSPRRHSSSSTSSSSGTNGSGSRTRSKSDLTPRTQRYRTTPDLLAPPFPPLRPPPGAYQAPPMIANHSPTHNFYGMGIPVMSPNPVPGSAMPNQPGPMHYIRYPAILPPSTGLPQQQSIQQQSSQPTAIVANASLTGGVVYQQLPPQHHFGIQHPQQQQQQQAGGIGPGSPGIGPGLVLSNPSLGRPAEVVMPLSKPVGGINNVSPSEETMTSSEGNEIGGGNVPGMDIISKLMHIPRQPQAASAFHQVVSLEQHHQHHHHHHHHQVPSVSTVSIGVTTEEDNHYTATPVIAGNAKRIHQDYTHPILPAPIHLSTGALALPPPHTAAAVTLVEHTEALLPNPQVIPSVTPITALTASAAATTVQTPPHLNQRKEFLCRYYMSGNGHCPYGDKCWFAHPELNHVIQPREFQPNTTAIPNAPLHIQVPPQPVQSWNPNLPVHYVTSPPQSPLDGTYISPNDPSTVGVRPPILHPSPSYPFPGQPPILVWQPTPRRGPRSFPLLPSLRPPFPVDPTLRFGLLSEVPVATNSPDGTPVKRISQLTTRADHFYVSFDNQVRDYKILFSGYRSQQESWMLQDSFSFKHKVTCLHVSRQQPFFLLVGTEAGLVCSCLLRKGNHYNQPTCTSLICSLEPPSAVTALVHFSTSITMAQVVVVGTGAGSVSWYIAQPPQKTFSLLSSAHPHQPHSIVALQVWGGMLVSGSSEGKVTVWSMRTQQPTISSEQLVHSVSLNNIHVQDTTSIITIGRGSTEQEDTTRGGGGEAIPGGSVSAPSSSSSSQPIQADKSASIPVQNSIPHHEGSGTESANIKQMTQDLTKLSVVADLGGGKTSADYEETVTLWQYSVPLQPVNIQGDLGEIVTSDFHQAQTGNMFLALALSDCTVKIFNLPNFSLASELHFPEMAGKKCLHIALNFSRESPVPNSNYYKNPFRDLILTTAWSDGKVMICQVSKQ